MRTPRTTVEAVEPFILECRETVKAIVNHLLAVKAGNGERLREALHEARMLTQSSRQAGFPKVTHLSSHMESLIEAAEEEGPEQLNRSLEVLCDMCAHIVLYVDTVLLYADTIAMVIEFPWMRDAVSQRLQHFAPENLLNDPLVEGMAAPRTDAGETVVRLDAEEAASDPTATLESLERTFDETPETSGWVVEVTRAQEVPLWLLGALVSYHVAMQRQGRYVRLAGVPREGNPDTMLHRLSNRLKNGPVVAL